MTRALGSGIVRAHGTAHKDMYTTAADDIVTNDAKEAVS